MTRSASLACFATALLLLGCQSARRGEPLTGHTTPQAANLEQGRRLFYQNCHQCHPNGNAGLGPALNNKPAPRFLLKTQVRAGLGTMPSFSKDKISPEELDQLVDYLKALRQAR
jgi:mono/diheme cytochrome c family protein